MGRRSPVQGGSTWLVNPGTVAGISAPATWVLGDLATLHFTIQMTPAMAAPDKPAKRLSIVYVPNGRIMQQWMPKAEGTDFELPLLLQPFAPFRNHLLVVSGLCLSFSMGFQEDVEKARLRQMRDAQLEQAYYLSRFREEGMNE